jgi:hypothetical protein
VNLFIRIFAEAHNVVTGQANLLNLSRHDHPKVSGFMSSARRCVCSALDD